MFEQLIQQLSSLDDIKAIILGGSRATKKHDQTSDYDVYVYTSKPIDEDIRKTIIDPYVKYMEYSNRFWEPEDDGILNNGIEIEFIYRDINTIESHLMHTLNGNISHGYSTCFLDNFINGLILYEEDHVYTKIKNNLLKIDQTHMFDQIVIENAKLLRDSMPSLYYQIKKAIGRNDLISINHRLTEYFAILFDIVFAINHRLHPGEKRLLEYVNALPDLPKDFEYLVTLLLQTAYQNQEQLLETLDSLTSRMYTFISKYHHDVRCCRFEHKK